MKASVQAPEYSGPEQDGVRQVVQRLGSGNRFRRRPVVSGRGSGKDQPGQAEGQANTSRVRQGVGHGVTGVADADRRGQRQARKAGDRKM
eukprot:359285-Chlamydomonas_euryale.AAC.11